MCGASGGGEWNEIFAELTFIAVRSERPLSADSVEKLHRAKFALETWSDVLIAGRLVNVVSRSVLWRDDFLIIWPLRPTR